ncbi:MAG: TIR domain-containing protein [Rubrivivax sp.]|nr:TIR domain-containing protein [Rubrivivax sp.]
MSTSDRPAAAESAAVPASGFRYWAFISYAHVDERAAARLHSSLEAYKLPKPLVGTAPPHGGPAVPARPSPVFRDREELSASACLDERLKSALRDSLNMVVVCSPAAVRSRWVDEEVRCFKALHGESRVFCLIIDGEPNASDQPATAHQECFVPSVRHRIDAQGRLTDQRAEPIAADARPQRDPAQAALLKLVAGLVGVDFDALQQRHRKRQQQQRMQAALWASAAALLLAGLARYAVDQRSAALAELRLSTAKRLIEDGSARVAGAAVDEEGGWQRLLAAAAVAPQAGADVAINDLLRRQPDTPRALMAGSSTRLALSPSGDRLVSGGPDGQLRLWDARSGLPLGPRWQGHADPATRIEFNAAQTRTDLDINGIAFSPDGEHIATAGADSSIRLWDARNGVAVSAPWRGHRRYVTSLVFVPGGERIASVGDEELSMWEVSSGQLLGSTMTEPVRTFHCLAVSADGTRLVTCGAGGLGPGGLQLWNALNGAPVGAAWRGHAGDVLAAEFNPKGTRLVTAGADHLLLLWDVVTGRRLGAPWQGHSAAVRALAFSPDGTRVVSGSDDKTLREWDAATGQPIGGPWLGHKGAVTSVRFAPDGQRVYSGSPDGSVRIWRRHATTSAAVPFGDGYGGGIKLAFSADGQRMVTAGDHRDVRLRDAATGALLQPPLPLDFFPVRSAGFVAGSSTVYVFRHDGIAFWDVPTSKWVKPEHLNKLPNDMRPAALSPNGQRLIAWDALRERLQLFDVQSGVAVGSAWKAHEMAMISIAFSADGKRFVTTADDATAAIWDVAAGGPIGQRLRGHAGRVLSAALNADGSRVATAGSDGTVRVWDGSSGAPLGAPWRGHAGAVNRVAFGPDGSQLLSGGDDGMLRLWDVASGAALGSAWHEGAPEGAVESVAIHPSGLRAVSSYDDGSLRIWPMPKSAGAAACHVVTHNMSLGQWRDWVSPKLPYQCQCVDLPVAADDPAAPMPTASCAQVHGGATGR